jgi:hypothetical protein
MSDLIKALDLLSNASLRSDAAPSGSVQRVVASSEKIRACRVVAAQLTTASMRASSDFARFLSVAVAALLRAHGDADLTVWTVAEECLNGIVKALVADAH